VTLIPTLTPQSTDNLLMSLPSSRQYISYLSGGAGPCFYTLNSSSSSSAGGGLLYTTNSTNNQQGNPLQQQQQQQQQPVKEAGQ
jgi:hypothetical protein